MDIEYRKAGCIDWLVLHDRLLLVLGWESEADEVHRLKLMSRNLDIGLTSVFSQRYQRSDIVEQSEALQISASVEHGYLAVFQLDANAAQILSEIKLANCSLYLGQDVVIQRHQCKVLNMAEASAARAFEYIWQDIYLSYINSSNEQVYFRLAGTQGGAANAQATADQATLIESAAILVSGWEIRASSSEFYYSVNDDPVLRPVGHINFSRRPDVVQHLAGLKMGPQGNNVMHGYHALIALPNEQLTGCTLQLFFKHGNNWTAAKPVSLLGSASLQTMLPDILLKLSCSRGLPLPGVGEFVLKLDRIARRDRPPESLVKQVYRLGAAVTGKSSVSIVIPFYGEAFFIRHLVANLNAMPFDAELVIVCDDPNLEQPLLNYLFNHASLLVRPVVFITLSENIGYAAANNIGVSFAVGESLLLMNSDIYADNFQWLTYALTLLNEDVGAVGFTLQFEDGTIQHNGMTFERNLAFNNHYLTEHPDKGMPATFSGLSHREVGACTAALLLLPRSSLIDGSVFDYEYLRGDFEDSALNLRLRKAGKKILIVEAPGVYHLERQSIRGMGDPGWRMRLTLLNCQTFNRNWAEYIDQTWQGSRA